jgi:hypothetical protein
VKDPKRTPATVSLSDLQEPQKNSLSNDIVWSHRSHPEVLRVATEGVQFFDLLPTISRSKSLGK